MKKLCFAFAFTLVPMLAHAQADSIAPNASNMSTQSAVEFAKGMKAGWNVGNSLEATGGETNWGNPKISQLLIDSVKAAGFNAIRLPVAWSRFSNASTYKIDSGWMVRVETVVNYALKRDLYVILNEHWDGGWLQPTKAAQPEANKRLAAIWKQVAVHFRDYGDKLLFAGTNEVMVDGDYGTPTTEYVDVQNGYNQVFVKTVRSTGGRNSYRYLVVQGFNTNIDHAVSFLKIPGDEAKNRLMVEVHFYDPYDFTLKELSTITQWGANATDPAKVASWGNESNVDTQFGKMKSTFADKGYPVIIGEYGAISRTTVPDHAKYRLAWDKYVTESAAKNGLVPFYWDNGGTKDLTFGLFARSTGKQAYPDIVNAIVNAAGGTASVGAARAGHSLEIRVSRNSGGIAIENLGARSMTGSVLDAGGRVLGSIRIKPGTHTYAVGAPGPGLRVLVIDDATQAIRHSWVQTD